MDLGLVLYQPEIAANLGAVIRICACFGATVDVIEPCGFPWRAKDIDRVAMDYGTAISMKRHASWNAYLDHQPPRLILLTTGADLAHTEINYQQGDRFLIGQESAGVPEAIHASVPLRAKIPLAPEARSLNMAVAGAVALAEARRQLSLQD